MTPNWFATFALLAWPVFALWLFRTRPIAKAILWTVLGGLLLLPVGMGIKIAPGIPQLDKDTIPSLAAFACCAFIARRPVRFWKKIGPAELLLLVYIFEPFISSMLNRNVIFAGGGRVLPASGYYDGISAVESQIIVLLPFFIGRQFLRSTKNVAEILRVLVIAGLFYTLPILIELRMSPQFHNWLYGYQPSQFVQEMRDNGWRPMVLMGHGLLLAFFLMTTTVAAAAFWRARVRVARFGPASVTLYLSAILVMCKSAGASVYAFFLIPLVRLTTPRLQLRIAAILVSIALLYPVLRAADLVPTGAMVDAATTYLNAERARSLETRFEQERQLLARASERFWFGWGRWGRSRIYDAETGDDVSLTDGRWVITMGQFGFIGFLAEFGLLALPVFRAAATLRSLRSKEDGLYLAALALIIAINMIDLLPNSSLSPWTWLLAGALLGRNEEAREFVRKGIFTPHENLPLATIATRKDDELVSGHQGADVLESNK
ncbi:MAG: hypothetical protein ACYC5H_11820 [Methylovirgula sp.]